MYASSRSARVRDDQGLDPSGAMRRRPARAGLGLGGILAALAIAGASLAVPLEARAEVFEGFPDVLICDGGEEIGKVAFYVSLRDPQGNVTYRAQVKRPVVITVAADGRVTTDGRFCAGETVEGLRKAGLALDLGG